MNARVSTGSTQRIKLARNDTIVCCALGFKRCMETLSMLYNRPKLKRLLLAAVVLMPVTGQALAQPRPPSHDLVGDYSLRDGGPAELRIIRDASLVQVSAREGDGSWSPPDAVEPCEEAVYAGVFGADWATLNVHGLCSTRGSFGLFSLDKGATVDGHTFSTGYFMVFVGGVDVFPL